MLDKYQVYLVYSANRYRIFISPNPSGDLVYLKAEGYQQGIALSPYLPIAKAFFLWHRLSDLTERNGKTLNQKVTFWGKLLGIGSRPLRLIINEKKQKAKKLLQELGYGGFLSYPLETTTTIQPTPNLQTVIQMLNGRILLPSEIEKLYLEHRQTIPKALWFSLQALWLEGSVEILPAVEKTEAGYRCNRCGQEKGVIEVDCVRCGTTCMICEECISMGEARACTPLIATQGSLELNLTRQNHQARLSFALTQAQRDAAKQVTKFFVGQQGVKEQEACLVWAVCGAGKTEVSFGAIVEALNRGEKVLFAIPRRDVVMELEPRLQKAFPGIKITCLYGGSEGKFKEGQIIIATTHQAIRFYKKFSLIVLDEADAYPYQGSKMLYHFVQRAKHPSGKIVYMTATPSKELLALIDQGKLRKVTIPARHHGFPLPEPKFLAAPGLEVSKNNSLKIPIDVLQWLHKVIEGDKGQVFIFVPTIKLAETVALNLKEDLSKLPFSFPPEWVQFSHSKDPSRDEKRKQFKEGQFPIFVTTSIMERGITVPRAKVLVLFADFIRIFDQGTLVQMAGRSGRLDEDPVGEVLFVGKKLTTEIQEASKVIQKMNLEAAEKGYLNV